MNGVCFRQPGKRMPGEDYFKLESLKFVGCLDHHARQTAGVKGHTQEVLLVVVRDAHRNLFGSQCGQALAFAAHLGVSLE